MIAMMNVVTHDILGLLFTQLICVLSLVALGVVVALASVTHGRKPVPIRVKPTVLRWRTNMESIRPDLSGHPIRRNPRGPPRVNSPTQHDRTVDPGPSARRHHAT